MRNKHLLTAVLAAFIGTGLPSFAQADNSRTSPQAPNDGLPARNDRSQGSQTPDDSSLEDALYEADTSDVILLQDVVVSATRAPKEAPFAVSNLSRKELADFARSGKELPFLLSRTPGVTAWSENGTGIGTSYMRIRGAGGSNINVTLDGVPLNSPEDQCVFWANMNSYSQLLGSVQIQRGIGSSTNGDGVFGGTVSLGTLEPSLTPSATVNVSPSGSALRTTPTRPISSPFARKKTRSPVSGSPYGASSSVRSLYKLYSVRISAKRAQSGSNGISSASTPA